MQEIIGNQMSQELRKRMEFYYGRYGYNVCGEIFLTNKYGAAIAATDKTSDYRQDDEEWWQVAKKEGLSVSEMEYDESSGVYSIPIGVRIDDENGSFVGVMKFVLNMEGSFNVIKEAKSASTYNTTGFKLMDKKGIIIFDSEGNFQPLENVSGEGFFQEAKSESGYFIKTAERNESEEFFAYARSTGYKDFRGFGWILMLEYDSKEVFGGPIDNIRYTLMLVSFLGVLLAIFLALYVYNSVSRPLMKLETAAKEIGKGRYVEMKIKSSDEIGQLGRTLGQMSHELKKSQEQIMAHSEELERTVKERTAELDQKVEELEENRTAVLNMMEDSEESNRQLLKAQEELKKALDETRKLDVKKDEFISITAHEFKTPLTAIHGFSELLQNGKIDEKSRQKYLKIMMAETKRLARLVTDILDLSRIDLGTFKFSFDDVDVREIIDDVTIEMSIPAERKGLKTFYSISGEVPKTVLMDSERLRQILINLLTNAVKYTPKGSVSLSVVKDKNNVHFSIKDTGIGIAKEHVSKLFHRFYQIDSSYTRAEKGSGLGLAICKEFLEGMGGRIWLDSELGKGSTFHFTLPIKQKAGGPTSQAQKSTNSKPLV
jgi:signal transduction histidine kinase